MVINQKTIEKLIKDLESIKEESELLELTIEEVKSNASEEEKNEVQKVKAKIKEKTEKSLKKHLDKQSSNQDKLNDLEEKKVFMVGQLFLKKNKDELSEEEKNLLDKLLGM